MKIDTDGLKAAFRDYVRGQAPASIKDCPSPEKMVRLLRSGASDKEATAILDHITRCRSCFSEFEWVRDILRLEKNLVQELESSLAKRADESSPGRVPVRKIRPRRPDWRAFIPRMSWAAALLLAGLIIVSAVVLKTGLFHTSEEYRSPSSAGVKLVEPTRVKVVRSGLVFRWEKVRNCQHYILELFDQALAPIWTSGPIPEESAPLPGELADSLHIDEPYFWMVTAVLADGERISSPLARIVLKK